MSLIALLASTAVPLHFSPPDRFEKRFIEISRRTVDSPAGETFHDHAVDFKVRITGRHEGLTAVDTTILRSKIRMSANYRQHARIPEFERLAKGTVARAMVDENGAVNKMSVLKAQSYEKGIFTGYSLSAAAAYGLHGFFLPGGFMQVGGTWKAEASMKEPMSFLGVTVPDKAYPVTFKLVAIKNFGGVPHARITFRSSVETEAEDGTLKYKMFIKEEGFGWVNVKTGFPKEIKRITKIRTKGDDNSSIHKVTTVVAQ
jgi:hypothetical protein